jgi:hypothetical protein
VHPDQPRKKSFFGMKKLPATALVLLSLSGTSAMAQPPQLLGMYDQWSAWTFREHKAKACYIYSDAVTKEPSSLAHGRVGLSIRRLKDGKARTEASFQTGYELAPRMLQVTVDRKEFSMISRGQNAWLRREEREWEFMNALTKGRTLVVEAVSKRGNKTSYSFSLKGVAAAMRKAQQACP